MLRELTTLPRALWVLFVATATLRLGAFVYPYLTIYLTRERGFSTLEVGWVLAAGGLGLIVGNVIGGQLTDRFNRKGTLLIALATNSVGYLALLAAHSSAAGYALSLGLAFLGMGMFTPAAQTIVADLAGPSRRTLAYTGFYLSSNLGIALGPLIGGVLADRSFALVFVGDVLSTCVCMTLVAFGIPRTTSPSQSHQRTPETAGSSRTHGGVLGAYSAHPRVTLFCVSAFFLIAPLMGLEYAVPLLVDREFDASLSWVGAVYSINAVTILSTSLALERWVRGRSEVQFMTLAAALWIAGLAILANGWSVPALVASTAVWTLGEVLVSILLPSFVAGHVADAVKGRFLALADLGRSTAYLLGPIGLGYAWNEHGAAFAFRLILATPILGLIAFGTMALYGRRAAVPSRSAS